MSKTRTSVEELRQRALGLVGADLDVLHETGQDLDIVARDNSESAKMAQYAKDIAWTTIETEAVKLSVAGYSAAEIAEKLDCSLSTVKNRLKKVMIKTAQRAGVEELRGRELRRYERIQQKLWELIDPDDPEASMSFAALDKFMAVSKAKREMMGVDKPIDHTVHIDGSVTTNTRALDKATDLANFLELADMLANTGLGSGREILDAEVVEDEVNELAEMLALSKAGEDIGNVAMFASAQDDDSDSDKDSDKDSDNG